MVILALNPENENQLAELLDQVARDHTIVLIKEGMEVAQLTSLPNKSHNEMGCNSKQIRKDQIEHAKVVYEKNKEIYKYTFEVMKFLDSKLTRVMSLITFIFTVQTGLISVVFLKMDTSWERWILLIISIFAYTLLIHLLSRALLISIPQERPMLDTDSSFTVKELNSFSEDFSKTLQIYVDITNDFASINNGLSFRNKAHAAELIDIHKILRIAYILVGLEALVLCLVSNQI